MVSPGTTATEPPADVVTGGVPTVAVFTPEVRWPVSTLALELVVVPAGVTAEEPAPAVVTGGLWGPPVAVVTAPARLLASLLALDTAFAPAGSTSEDEPAIEVAVGGVPAPSDDELD